MKSLVVLGATGPSGLQIVQQALDRDYQVTAVVRNPDRMTISHDNLKVEIADVFSATSLLPHFKSKDAVIVCLGTGPSFRTITLHRESIKSIVEAMRQANVDRAVIMSSACSVSKPENPLWIEWLLKPLFLGRNLADMAIMENYLESCSDINYTVVKPPQLGNGPLSDKPLQFEIGQQYVGGSSSMRTVPRASVAKWMLDTLDTDQFDGKMVAVALQ